MTRSSSTWELSWVVFSVLVAAFGPIGGLIVTATTIEPGVVFEPSLSWARISFASPQTFAAVRVDETGVTFDSVRLGVQKFPTSVPRAEMTITAWTPSQSSVGGTVLRFTGDSPAGSTVYFGLADIIPAREYILDIDGAEETRRYSDAGGNVSFSWGNWSVHDFQVRLGSGSGLPGPSPLSADFTHSPSAPVVNQPIAFAASVAGGTPPYTVTWDFGDGFTGTGLTPSHSFASSGSFLVAVFVTDSGSQATTASTTVVVRAIPPPPEPVSADFTFSPSRPVAGAVVSFAASAAGGTAPYAYGWDFGDTSSGTGAVTNHTYSLPGSFIVYLNASDSAGGSYVTAKAIVVDPRRAVANVSAAFDLFVRGDTVTFTDRSDSEGLLAVSSWFWAFGDGTWSRDQNPSHAYPVPVFIETYRVDLIACDSAGNCGSASTQITFYNWPVIIGSIALPAAGVVLLLAMMRRRRRRRPTRSADDPEDSRKIES